MNRLITFSGGRTMEKRLLVLIEKNYLLGIKNIDEKIQQLKDNQELIKLILQ